MTHLNKLVAGALVVGLVQLSDFSQLHAAFTLQAPPGTLPPEAPVNLSRQDIDQRSSARILYGSAETDGSLKLIVDKEPGVFTLEAGGTKLTLAAAKDETLVLKKSAAGLSIEGSSGTHLLRQYETFRQDSLARLVYPTRRNIEKAKARSADEKEIAELTQAEVDAYQTHIRELNDFVIDHIGESMALYGASLRLDGSYRGGELAALVRSFSKVHGDIEASRSLEARIATAGRTALGALAPELASNNLKGKTERLSDYRGRYVLLDFWASWCPPCRLENRHYAELTHKIEAEQFTIFAVNLDTSDKVWSQAVRRDKAEWIHISDLKGWNSELATTYGVSALPTSFLINPEGRIIAKNLRGAALDAKLSELGLL